MAVDQLIDHCGKCSALLTMLLREDHFCNGAFDQRVESGQGERIVQRMIKLLEK